MSDSLADMVDTSFLRLELFLCFFPCLFEQVMTFDYLLKRPSEHLRLLNTFTWIITFEHFLRP